MIKKEEAIEIITSVISEIEISHDDWYAEVSLLKQVIKFLELK